MKRALVLGGTGFIGGHLTTFLKEKGYFVRVVDQHVGDYPSDADEIYIKDLRNDYEALQAFSGHKWDEVYQLAADMGGMGFIHTNELATLTNNVKINLNCLEAARIHKAQKYFYSSSVCIYPDMKHGQRAMKEEDAYPALPDNEYGWEKLYSERLASSYAKTYNMYVRIARFQNCYGELGTWKGGREKAPAALCRKIANLKKGKDIEVWGDGTAVRNFIYVADLVEAVYMLMHSDIDTPVNIGTEEYVTVNGLVDTIALVAGKSVNKRYIDGPVGVESRNFSHEKIRSLGWKPKFTLLEGIKRTYPWIEKQVNNS